MTGTEQARPKRPGTVASNLATLVGGLVLFFAIPVRGSAAIGSLAVSSLIACVGVATVAWVVVRQVRGVGRLELAPLQLVLLAEIVACAFSLGYYSLAVSGQDQFVGLHTRLDALYFTMSTMTTVGYGDVHPVGQLARGVVCVQLAFNLVFLGVLAQLLRRRLADRETGTDHTDL